MSEPDRTLAKHAACPGSDGVAHKGTLLFAALTGKMLFRPSVRLKVRNADRLVPALRASLMGMSVPDEVCCDELAEALCCGRAAVPPDPLQPAKARPTPSVAGRKK